MSQTKQNIMTVLQCLLKYVESLRENEAWKALELGIEGGLALFFGLATAVAVIMAMFLLYAVLLFWGV